MWDIAVFQCQTLPPTIIIMLLFIASDHKTGEIKKEIRMINDTDAELTRAHVHAHMRGECCDLQLSTKQLLMCPSMKQTDVPHRLSEVFKTCGCGPWLCEAVAPVIVP